MVKQELRRAAGAQAARISSMPIGLTQSTGRVCSGGGDSRAACGTETMLVDVPGSDVVVNATLWQAHELRKQSLLRRSNTVEL